MTLAPAQGVDDVIAQAQASTSAVALSSAVRECRACPRLVAWREEAAATRRKSFADQHYWGRPIAGWGSERPRILVIGLAPAAHGGNRTGRIFTGDESGNFLFAALQRAGLARLATSDAVGDGQRLLHTRMVAAVRCAPPANKPTPLERDTCAPWLDRELALVGADLRVVLALGAFAWQAAIKALSRVGLCPPDLPRFGHGAVALGEKVSLVASYHPSQQNTYTGRLTAAMADDVMSTAVRLADTAGA